MITPFPNIEISNQNQIDAFPFVTRHKPLTTMGPSGALSVVTHLVLNPWTSLFQGTWNYLTHDLALGVLFME
jgi:hypothetical protein